MKIRIAKKIWKISNKENTQFYNEYYIWYNKIKSCNVHSLQYVALKYLKPEPQWTYSTYQRQNAILYRNRWLKNINNE